MGADKGSLFEWRANADASQTRNANAEHAHEMRMFSDYDMLLCNSRYSSNYDSDSGR